MLILHFTSDNLNPTIKLKKQMGAPHNTEDTENYGRNTEFSTAWKF